jgi:putative thiazole/oxazole-modified microcin (TOMM)-like peptide
VSEPTFTNADRAKFAGLVARIWSDPDLAARYDQDGRSVLAENGIELAAGMVVPVIPERPEGDISIEELETVSAGLSVSSLACAACPVSSFSSLSN